MQVLPISMDSQKQKLLLLIDESGISFAPEKLPLAVTAKMAEH
jgi:hypothetical protein